MDTSQTTASSKKSLISRPSDYEEIQEKYNKLEDTTHNSPWVMRALDLATYMSAWAQRTGKNSSFLDVGCREGYVMDFLVEKFPSARTYGVDVVTSFIEKVNDHHESSVMDMHYMDFDYEEFDWVYCCQTLEHAYDPGQAAWQMHRVAKHGVCISVPVESKESFDGNPSHYVNYNLRDWWDCFDKAIKAVHPNKFHPVQFSYKPFQNCEGGELIYVCVNKELIA